MRRWVHSFFMKQLCGTRTKFEHKLTKLMKYSIIYQQPVRAERHISQSCLEYCKECFKVKPTRVQRQKTYSTIIINYIWNLNQQYISCEFFSLTYWKNPHMHSKFCDTVVTMVVFFLISGLMRERTIN